LAPLTWAVGRGSILPAALAVLQDGVARTAQQIFDLAKARGLVGDGASSKYVYTSLIEYIARANGNGRRPAIVQNGDRTFRVNEPPDGWPAVALPADPAPSAQALAAADALESSARSGDGAAFERAVCDAFAALGFAAVHLGGQKAPDGYADAQLGPLGYRVMLECKTGAWAVTHPDTFEAAKYREAYGARYCALVGSAFNTELELVKELQTHNVSAWTVADLRALLLAESDAWEMRACFAPGFASDGVAHLLWERVHGERKRVAFCAEAIVRVGRGMQEAAAGVGDAADAPPLTVDVAMYAVDRELAVAGAKVTCSRQDVVAAFAYLAHPLVGRAAFVDDGREAVVVRRPSTSSG
jgi:hypothetical protein